MCSIGAVFSVASMGVGVFGQMQQMRAMKQQQAAQQAMYEAQRRQQEEQAKAAMLATQQKIQDRKREAARLSKSNRASLAATGANIDSPSFGAFFESEKKATGRDVRRLSINGLTDAVFYQNQARQTGLAASASKAGFKGQMTAMRYGMLGDALSTGAKIGPEIQEALK
tara:strand:+ start:376 stop:882 length:507 start_codon:yes stop_codon:yes gene_type:complete